MIEIIHHEAIPQQHGKTRSHGTAEPPEMHAKRNGQQKVQYPRQKIDLRAKIIPIHRLQDGQSDILDKVNGKRQDNEDGNPVSIFKSAARPEGDELPAEDDEACGHQSQQIILPTANLDEQRRKLLQWTPFGHEFRDVRQVNTRNCRRKSHIIHVDQRRDGINGHRARPLHDAQDDLIRLPEDLVNEADKEDAERQLLEIMEQRLIPVMKADRDMQARKAVIHARENQGHVQGRLGNGNGHRRRDFLENEDDEEWLQDQLHRFEPLQEQELLMRIDDRTEHHRREAHGDIEQQQ